MLAQITLRVIKTYLPETSLFSVNQTTPNKLFNPIV